MNTQLLADTIACLDKELFDEVIVEHYKRTMEKKTLIVYKYVAVAAAAVLLTVGAVVPLIAYNLTSNVSPPNNSEVLPSGVSNDYSDTFFPSRTDEQVYSPLRGGFVQVSIDKVYDGIFSDGPNDAVRYIVVDCTALHDLFERIPDQTKLTIRVRLGMYPVCEKNTPQNTEVRKDEDGVPQESTMEHLNEWIYDNAQEYKEFLLEYNEGYLFVPGWKKIEKEVYSFEKNEYETISLSLPDCFSFNNYCYLPILGDKIDLDTIHRFVEKNQDGYYWFINGDIIKNGMDKALFEKEFKALLSKTERNDQ